MSSMKKVTAPPAGVGGATFQKKPESTPSAGVLYTTPPSGIEYAFQALVSVNGTSAAPAAENVTTSPPAAPRAWNVTLVAPAARHTGGWVYCASHILAQVTPDHAGVTALGVKRHTEQTPTALATRAAQASGRTPVGTLSAPMSPCQPLG